MMNIFMFLMGAAAGGVSLGILLWMKLRTISEQKWELDRFQAEVKRHQASLRAREAEIDQRAIDIESRHVKYPELVDENTMLKRDLQNVDVHLRKLELDRQAQQRRQEEITGRVEELGSRYLKDNVSWIAKSLTTNNFVKSKQRLLDVIERCRGVGFEVSEDEESQLVADLKREFEKIVRAAAEKEEQARIKAQIREQQKLEREIERELKQAEREREAVRAALDRALAEAEDEHSQEIESLRERLADAEAKMERTKSRAEMTKAGHVYVISNIGAFGKDVYKIGMTRRLDPADRVRELSSASVPFSFDVHMMLSCDDAPKLENALHRALQKERINKVNLRKEFFRTDIESIRRIVEENHGEVEYVADAEALEYLQSMEMTTEDQAYLETVFAESEDEDAVYED